MGAFFHELFQTNIYKRSQGRISRQITFATVAIVLASGCWRLSLEFETLEWNWVRAANLTGFYYWFPGLLCLGALWTAYRIVNVPVFADFLIAVEAEMNKVSWPTRGELVRSSIVVLFTIFFFAVILFGFDFFWQQIFIFLKVIPRPGPA